MPPYLKRAREGNPGEPGGPDARRPRNATVYDSDSEEQLRVIDPKDITVAIFCALPYEAVAVRHTLDEPLECNATGRQNYVYSFGRIREHNLVIARPEQMGPVNAAQCAATVSQQFANVRIALMVGIGAGIPSEKSDIRLGDVAVSIPKDSRPGVHQYDFGKYEPYGKFVPKGTLDRPPRILTSADGLLEEDELMEKNPMKKILRHITKNPRYQRPTSDDILFANTFNHVKGSSCDACKASRNVQVVPRKPRPSPDEPVVHRGLIMSGGGVVKNPEDRERLCRDCEGAICFEMEAAGIMNEIPCLVIRGICDYADTHKQDDWHHYAAAVAAAYCKALLYKVRGGDVEQTLTLKEVMKKVESKLADIQTIAMATNMTAQSLRTSDHLHKIRRWLSPPDPSMNFNRAREQHQEGTGQWLIQGDTYAAWKGSPSSFLWLNGIPGCGKTILSSSVVADLQSTCSESLVYFYFDFNDVEKQSHDKAVRSLITQLYDNRPDVRGVVDALYSTCGTGGRQPSVDSLCTTFQDMLKHLKGTWIVLDALDECPKRSDGSARGLLPWIHSLRDACLDIHLLVTSRPEHDINAAIVKFASTAEIIPLQSALVKDDINAYIRTRTKQMVRWQNKSEVQLEIESALAAKADGMFRWVSCQFDVLDECLNLSSVRRELQNLPHTLHATYERILKSMRPEKMKYAIRLLQFITYSERPLQLKEVVDALAVDTSRDPQFDPDDRLPLPEEVALYCPSLVVLVTRDGGGDETTHLYRYQETSTYIRLAHFSVQEYVTSEQIDSTLAEHFNELPARLEIIDVCISYLSGVANLEDLPDETEKYHMGDIELDKMSLLYPLVLYSARYWAEHARVVELLGDDIPSPVKRILSSNKLFALSCQHYPPFGGHSGGSDWNLDIANALYYTSYRGLLHSTRLLIDDGADINRKCAHGKYTTALQAASAHGHERIVRLLLEKGAVVDVLQVGSETALQAASANGHETIVRLLLEKDAAVDTVPVGSKTALQAASAHGHERIVRLLLEKGAVVDTVPVDSETALHAASARGHETIVRLLLEKGAPVNTTSVDTRSGRSTRWKTALTAASRGGHESIVKLLLARGAAIGPTDLAAASRGGNESIVKLLLGRGAAIGPADLAVASRGGHESIVKLLLGRGAAIGPTDLAAASLGGNESIVNLLLERGADMGFALHVASGWGRTSIAFLLLNKGAEPNLRGWKGRAALHAVSEGSGAPDLVKLLLERGAKVNMMDDDGRTPLSLASERGRSKLVEALLHNKANPHIRDKNGRSALDYCTTEWDSKVKALLLAALGEREG